MADKKTPSQVNDKAREIIEESRKQHGMNGARRSVHCKKAGIAPI